jgi:hypothetical protein
MPVENIRFEPPRESLDQCVQIIQKHVGFGLARLLFNIEEGGCGESEKRSRKHR